VTGHGRSELLNVISAIVDAGPAEPEPTPESAALPEEIEPPFSIKVRAGNAREKDPREKKKLKGARPW